MRSFLSLGCAVLTAGCASVLGSKQADFSFNSNPQQAEVLVDGNPMGETPLKVKLSNTKAHTVTFRKEGFQDVSRQLEKGMGAGWVIFEVLPVAPSAEPDDGAGLPVTPVTPPQPTRPAPAAPSAASTRFKAELLEDKEFRVAFDDVQRLGVALDFQEAQFGLLQITVGPGFATVSSARYNLEHLYSAYRIASYRRVDPVIELWKDGAKIGEVTADGVLVGPEFSAPR